MTNDASSNSTILIVEDEEKLALLLSDYLKNSGFQTHCIYEGTSVAAWVKANKPSLILLDLMLPGKDGMDVCKDIRAFSNTPIIMVTARVEEIDRLLGLELGADDYICKPFSPREVVARVKAVLRRTGATPSSTDSIIKLDEARYQATANDQPLNLTAVEFQLLNILVSDPGRIYSREQLMDHIYNDHRIVNDRTIDSHIKKLRKRIGEVIPNTTIIHSVYGVGYKYEPAI